jgi:hypothetical protein
MNFPPPRPGKNARSFDSLERFGRLRPAMAAEFLKGQNANE